MRFLRFLKKPGIHMAVFPPVALLVFLRQLHTGPMFDDFVYFLWFDSTPWNQLHYLLDPGNGYIWARPLATFIFYLEYHLTHECMAGYRIAGILWHGLIAATVTTWVRRGLRLPDTPAILAGWLFLLHPAAVQSVCYPSARGEQVFLALLLWSMIFVSHYLTHDSGRPIRSVITLSAAMAAYTLALAAKESAIGFTVFLVLYAGCFKYRIHPRRRLIPALTATAALTGTYLLYRMSVMQGVGGYGWMTRSGQDPLALAGSSLRWLFWDLPLLHFFPWPPGPSGIPWVLKILSALLLLLTLILGITTGRHRRSLVFSGLFLLISEMMITAVFAGSNPDILAPRYLYLGSVAAAVILALALAPAFRPASQSRIPVRAGSMVLAAFLIPVWAVSQSGFQSDFAGSGRASTDILELIRPHCHYLMSGGEIDIYNVPDRIGSISINIPSDRLAIFNLEGHRQCGLAVRFDMAAGQDAGHWFAYMDNLPGRIGVYRDPPPEKRPAGIIVLDFLRERKQL